jgi:heptosyltransferase-2
MEKASARILVIRGGALGDFVLTLPALRLLREAFPSAWIEVLGYPHIAALADGRFYANRVRSMDYGPLAGFFARNGTLDAELSAYFAGFQQVVSYLFDPDGIFESNLRKAGVRNYLPAFRRPVREHAAFEWARPLEGLALFLEDPAAVLFLTDEDRREAAAFLGEDSRVRLALHPGSGSPLKNWGVSRWEEIGLRFLAGHPGGELLVVGGEADAEALRRLEIAWSGLPVRFAVGLKLTLLAAVLGEVGRFAGHDSGVSHVAAAAGVRSVLLFGPTDPGVWAPRNAGVRVVRAPGGRWEDLSPDAVWENVAEVLP